MSKKRISPIEISHLPKAVDPLIIIVLLIVGSFWLVATIGHDVIDRIFSAQPARATVNLTDTITSTLTASAELVTGEEVMRKVRARVNVSRGPFNMGGYGATYEADIVVRYGYNLLRDEFKVELNGPRTVRITLPKVELISCSMTPVEEKDRSTAMFPDWAATRELGEYMLMNKAVEQGISHQDNLTLARNNAREIIRRIVNGIDSNITVEFEFLETPAQTRVDTTCRPPTPMRWSHDEATDSWILN